MLTLFALALLACSGSPSSDADTRSQTTYGTPDTDPCPAGDGEIWVLPGAALLSGALERDDALTVIGSGQRESGRLRIGRLLEPLGDLDGDGLSELAVGWGASVTVLAGASLAAGTADLDDPFAWYDEAYPNGLSLVGDRDGDGLPELAVTTTLGSYTGSTVVLPTGALAQGGRVGAAEAWSELVDLDTEAIDHVRPDGGDFDGDGALDLVLWSTLPGDATPDQDGPVYRRFDVWLAADLVPGALLGSDRASAHILESADLELHHDTQGRLGDLDGDGTDDLLVGRHIFSGTQLTGGVELSAADALSSPGVAAPDRAPLAWLDIDGDGVHELLVQDIGWAGGGAGGLEVDLVSGASWTDGHGLGTVLASSGQDLQHAVLDVGAVPDLDGDGLDEGWAFLGLGHAPEPPELRVWSSASLREGWDLAAPDGRVALPDCGGETQVVPLGDLDGDGRSEVAVSLPANEL